MTSDFWTIFWSALIGIFVWDAIKAIYGRLSHVRFGREAVARPPAPEIRNIAAVSVQRGLQEMLNRAAIVGDFDYRDGKVSLPVPPEQVHPIAAIITNAVSHVAMQPNPNSVSMYWRDSVNDRFHILPDLDFEVLREAASIMRRVAEDRRLSTKLYQGLTDSELVNLARTYMISLHTERGDHASANLYRTGERDGSAAMQNVIEIIKFLYQIKGAKPE